ncbi:MAG: NTP transferase domain-containing protein, partial [Rhodospirillaceae bacterium]|nr:NTP transferase domain-containing protein [Rhodospirillaceae bacterium]
MPAPSLNTVNSLENIDVVILAGGLGTRVSSILKDTPKVLAPIDGRPYLEHLIDRLTGFGARRILLLIGHLADAVKTHVETNPRPDCEIISII